MNIDRSTGQTGTAAAGTDKIGLDNIPNTGLIYPWIIKDGTRLNFRTNTAASFNESLPGDIITGASYPYTSSISKEFYTPTTPRHTPAEINPTPASGGDPEIIAGTATVSHLRALKNTINYYRYISPQFEYSSSANAILSGRHNRDFDSSSLGLVSIPSIFYGSQIKKGSVNLEIYYTGSLIARAQDSNRNGELIQTLPWPAQY